jgi:hypothetical protein
VKQYSVHVGTCEEVLEEELLDDLLEDFDVDDFDEVDFDVDFDVDLVDFVGVDVGLVDDGFSALLPASFAFSMLC